MTGELVEGFDDAPTGGRQVPTGVRGPAPGPLRLDPGDLVVGVGVRRGEVEQGVGGIVPGVGGRDRGLDQHRRVTVHGRGVRHDALGEELVEGRRRPAARLAALHGEEVAGPGRGGGRGCHVAQAALDAGQEQLDLGHGRADPVAPGEGQRAHDGVTGFVEQPGLEQQLGAVHDDRVEAQLQRVEASGGVEQADEALLDAALSGEDHAEVVAHGGIAGGVTADGGIDRRARVGVVGDRDGRERRAQVELGFEQLAACGMQDGPVAADVDEHLGVTELGCERQCAVGHGEGLLAPVHPLLHEGALGEAAQQDRRGGIGVELVEAVELAERGELVAAQREEPGEVRALLERLGRDAGLLGGGQRPLRPFHGANEAPGRLLGVGDGALHAHEIAARHQLGQLPQGRQGAHRIDTDAGDGVLQRRPVAGRCRVGGPGVRAVSAVSAVGGGGGGVVVGLSRVLGARAAVRRGPAVAVVVRWRVRRRHGRSAPWAQEPFRRHGPPGEDSQAERARGMPSSWNSPCSSVRVSIDSSAAALISSIAVSGRSSRRPTT